MIPEHRLYCEPFFGGGALFFAKPKAEVEVINDVNGEVVNFFKVLKTKFPALQKEIQATLHSRELYRIAIQIYNDPESHSDVKRAWALWTATNQGFAGMIGSWGFGKTNSKENAVAAKREAFIEAYENRLRTVQVENNDALKVIARCNEKDAFIYCDPPYIGSDQGHYDGYTEAEYEKLLQALSKAKAKFLLSSYPSEILSKYIRKNGWKTKKIEKYVAVTKLTEKRKTEVLVYNYDLARITPHIGVEAEKETVALAGHIQQNKNQMKKNPYADIWRESLFIERFLGFHGKVLYKNTFGIFIDELQKAIEEKKIRKTSPVAKEINAIQKAAVDQFNKMYQADYFVLKPATIKHLNEIVAKWQNTVEVSDKIYAKSKKKVKALNGVSERNAAIISSSQFANLEFATIGLKDKWKDFIGDPSPGFTAMVFGMPKMGKSYLCVDFASYLAKNHGKVLYVSKEEFMSPTLALKIKDKEAANENLDIAGTIPTDLSPYGFVFLDSVTSLKLAPDQLKRLEEKYPNISFVYVFQVTKAGSARGTNEYMHNVDVVIEIPEKGKAIQFGRFNQGGKMDIFSPELYPAA
ncbi:hypothetical protein CNR22_13545 [Sphingobacteriaceae bacterium]|nr:hypothetical protein CNR22_13545 [Sphingobacteriaceae bacterium]